MLHKSHVTLASHFWRMLGVLKGMFDSTTCLSGASLMLYSESCNTLNRLQAFLSCLAQTFIPEWKVEKVEGAQARE